MSAAKTLASGLLITAGAALMLPIGAVTLFRARRAYSWMAAQLCRIVLWVHGVNVRVHGPRPFPRSQTIYISNHSSTLDLFVLVALRLPNCRFFMSGFLRKFIPLGVIAWMMGTFFTAPQNRPDLRRRIFTRAAGTLWRTRESVYLSPEGRRVVSGDIGHFNKGAFHLATVLHAPIVPMYFRIPRDVDPGLGYRARPGTVDVHVLPAIDTSGWVEADVRANADRMRELFVEFHERMRCTPSAA